MKNKLTILVCSILLSFTLKAQMKVGNNPTAINSASLLELETTNKGFVLPRLALTSLSSPSPLPTGLLTGTVVFNTATGVGSGIGLYYWSGTAWVAVTSSGSGSGSGWLITGNNNVNSSSFLGTTDPNVPLIFKVGNVQAGYLGISSSQVTTFGIGATGGGQQSTAIGAGATASQQAAIAVGYQANASQQNAIAIGNAAIASTNAGLAIGAGASASSQFAIAIGSGSQATSNPSTLSVGTLSSATGQSATAIGNGSHALGDNSIVLGTSSSVPAGTSSTILIGDGLTTSQSNALILGNAAKKIGMGTTTPQEKLDVVGNVRFSGALMPNGSAGAAGQVLTSAGAGAAPTWQPSGSGGGAWSLTGNAGTNYATNFIGTTNKVGFRVRTNNIERMLIDSLGNVTTTAQTVKTKLGAGGKFLIVNSGTGANELIKLLIRETGEVNWYLDGQDLFMRDGSFDAFGDGTLYKYDFMHIDGTNGRIGFNILNGYSDGSPGGENDLPLTSSVTLQGSIATKVRLLDGSTNYQIKQDDHILIVDKTDNLTSDMTLSPVATSRGREYIFKRNNNGTGRIIVQPVRGEKLNGIVNGAAVLGARNSVLEVVCGPDSWWVTSETDVVEQAQITTTSITASDKNIIEVNFTSAGQSINIKLPSAADNEDKTYTIKRNANGAVYTGNVLKIVPASGENLDQSSFDSPYIMENDFESVTVRSDSARWVILNNYNAENAVVAVTTAYTPYKNDKTILADASSASFTVTLPGAATVEKGKTYTVKRTNAGANTVIVDGKGSEKMDGIASLRLNQRFDYLQLQSDGTNWMIISERISPSLVVNPVLPYLATVYDGIISSNGNGTINLLGASAVLGGKIFTIKNSATAGNSTLTINPKGTETVDGLAKWPLLAGQFVTIQSDGTNWVVIGQ